MAFPFLKGIEEIFQLFGAEGIELGVQSFSLRAHQKRLKAFGEDILCKVKLEEQKRPRRDMPGPFAVLLQRDQADFARLRST